MGRDDDDEEEGRELDTIEERVIGEAEIGLEEDDPASNDSDNGLHGMVCFE